MNDNVSCRPEKSSVLLYNVIYLCISIKVTKRGLNAENSRQYLHQISSHPSEGKDEGASDKRKVTHSYPFLSFVCPSSPFTLSMPLPHLYLCPSLSFVLLHQTSWKIHSSAFSSQLPSSCSGANSQPQLRVCLKQNNKEMAGWIKQAPGGRRREEERRYGGAGRACWC